MVKLIFNPKNENNLTLIASSQTSKKVERNFNPFLTLRKTFNI